MKEITLAFAGQPNSGKTTIFNEITGARQHVGNWPGVTVEYKDGYKTIGDTTYKLVDLPGLYSMSANSYEEIVSRDFLIKEKVDIIVNIIDSSVLDRSLFLTTQLTEIGLPMVLVFNMDDIVQKNQTEIDYKRISESMNIPYIVTQGAKTKSWDKFYEIINEVYDNKEYYIPRHISFSGELETEITEMENSLKVKNPFQFTDKGNSTDTRHAHDIPGDIFVSKENNPIRLRWFIVRGFEGDKEAINMLQPNLISPKNLEAQIDIKRGHVTDVYGDSIDEIVTDDRYAFISGLINKFVSYSKTSNKVSITERIDNILLNKWLSIPFFAAIMYCAFYVAFNVGDFIAGYIDGWINGTDDFIGLVGYITESVPGALGELLGSGVVAGVGAVIVFLPYIACMFIVIAILEDSGYMARAAFVVDRAMHAFGLHGKSFVAMLLGFGCNIPAVMATRTMESRADRLITIFVIPLMSCSARLPIYTFFVAIFFEPKWRPLVLMSIYLIGILVAIIVGKICKGTMFDDKETPFVMEMPAYRWPTFKSTIIHTWDRTKQFIVRAGTIVAGCAILIWFISVYPSEDNSIVMMLGHWIEPIFKPIGLDWMAGVASIFGIGAKEVVVSALEVIAGAQGAGDAEAFIRSIYTPFQSYIFMMFCLMYWPCFATVITMKKEIGEWKYFLFSIIYPPLVAWVLCFIVWNIGKLFM
ncbi:MAG: ferrous iron transport protein B [Abditibacteriota bacterium]|nr:ferrous iron transport protein B [Abditibacteriota bacterium]